MAITIQSFSPLKNAISQYYLHSDRYTVAELTARGTEYYTKPELMFTDTNATLYCMVFRRRYGSSTILDLIQNSKLSGFGTSPYKYRIDFSNNIKIVHPEIELETVYYQYVKKHGYYINSSDIYVILSPTDITASTWYTNYVVTESSGNKYITLSNWNTYSPSGYVYKKNWNFHDFENNFVFMEQYSSDDYGTSKIYANSWTTIDVKSTGGTPNHSISNIVVKDASGSTIYSYATGISESSKDFATIFIYLPSNAATLLFTTNYWTGSTITVNNYTRAITNQCPTNQYFLYGTRLYLQSLLCFGKREEVSNIEKTTIKVGGVEKTLKLVNKKSYNQNVGLELNNTKVFELSVTPFLIEYDSVYSLVKKWNIANTTFEGYNTKRYGEKNFVLNLVQARDEERKTSFDLDFYS